MTHPIPAPRPSSDPLYRTPPRRGPLPGPFCPSCEHPSCRRRRAQHLPRLGGHRSEYSREHARVAALQARNPHLLLWFGEATLSYWVAGPTGLTEARTPRELLLLLDPAPAMV
ncbi:hypothetical protein [Nocardiopsis nanhaiensis]